MRSRFTAAAAALAAAASGFGLLGATGAQAAVHPHTTTVCGNAPGAAKCTSISSLLLNQNNDPSFVQNAVGGKTTVGRKINLRQASDTRTNEDFAITFAGNLGQLCGTGGVNSIDPTSYACLNYPDFYPVYQAQFEPDSNQTGDCVGALAAVAGYKSRLEPCGSPRTFWVGDLAASITLTFPSFQPLVYFPLEFAADTSASNPLVLTLNTNTTKPTNELFIQHENFSGGAVPDSQMFTLTGRVGLTFP